MVNILKVKVSVTWNCLNSNISHKFVEMKVRLDTVVISHVVNSMYCISSELMYIVNSTKSGYSYNHDLVVYYTTSQSFLLP